MNRPLELLLSLAAVAAPIPAAAQAWPATGAAAGARMAVPTAQPLVRVDRDVRAPRRPTAISPAQQPLLRLKPASVEVEDIPEVEIEPRDEWLDDQGLRVTPTRIAFKRRF